MSVGEDKGCAAAPSSAGNSVPCGSLRGEEGWGQKEKNEKTENVKRLVRG